MRRQRGLKVELYQLVEYVKWITNETTQLRARLSFAEKHISSLRKSGEQSVDSMIKMLQTLKAKQTELETDAEELREDIKDKEFEIKKQEHDLDEIQRAIENEKGQQAVELGIMWKKLDQQKEIIENLQNNFN